MNELSNNCEGYDKKGVKAMEIMLLICQVLCQLGVAGLNNIAMKRWTNWNVRG